MKNRNFEEWIETFISTIHTYTTWVDFSKVKRNANKLAVELNILNVLLGLDGEHIKNRFIQLIQEYPKCLQCIPLLLAIRDSKIKQMEGTFDFSSKYMMSLFKDKQVNYISFMEKSGLFEMMKNGSIKNLYDYVLGVETGLDTNARKNRVGQLMSNRVQDFFNKEHISYDKEMHCKKLQEKYNIDLPITNKRFDFVLKIDNVVFAVEVNFYSSGGSKLVPIAESYKNRYNILKDIKNFKFVWITDGKGWKNIDAKKSLEKTFNVLEDIYNLNDLKNRQFISILK